MDDLRNLWQKQEVEEVNLTIDELRAKASKFQSRIRWRNLREHAGCLIVIAAFGFAFLKSHELIPRISFALIIAAAIYIGWRLQKWGAPRAVPADMGRPNFVEFYRGELQRQSTLLRGVWRWYLGPLIPGMALLVAYRIWITPPDQRLFPIAYAMAAVVAFWLVGWINHRAAQRIEALLTELEHE